ncbi:MAG: PEP-CTERM sorting domain-containing protein [Steroidobacterales bacterium]
MPAHAIDIRPVRAFALACGLLLCVGQEAVAASILFVGNSFMFAQGSPVRYYRADTVTDINGTGIGGVPALFKSFASQAGLSYEVFLETEPGVGIDWHLEHKLPAIGARAWDSVVLQSYSTLDAQKAGDPVLLIASVQKIAGLLRTRNPGVELRLVATWPRADQVYDPKGAWYGKTIEAMALDVRAGYDRAAAATPGITAVVPVGEAWVRAMHEGLAAANPYDGIDAGKIDLWTYDHYHASTYGYYLEALVLFGSITGRDPRSLGDRECSGFELGLSSAQVHALQQVAYRQLALGAHPPKPAPAPAALPGAPQRCAPAKRV